MNYLIALLEGALSIFSPCILPVLPIYISVLSESQEGDDAADPASTGSKHQRRLMRNTLFFVLGISATFFLLGSITTALGSVLRQYRNMIMIVGSLFIVVMGLFYLGVLKLNVLNRETRKQYRAANMNPVSAFLLGFAFSFGWTPCIGPILSSILIMASTQDSIAHSYLLLSLYTIGFIVPFLLFALFFSKMIKKFAKLKSFMPMMTKISGFILLFAGALLFYNGVKGEAAVRGAAPQSSIVTESESVTAASGTSAAATAGTSAASGTGTSAASDAAGETAKQNKLVPIDFTLTDQFGNEHTLSKYKGKTVFLNFWATWCPPCRGEMPHMEELYQEYQKSGEDVVILGVASPNFSNEGSRDDVIKFLTKNGYTFPVVFDEGGTLMQQYGLNSFPSTLIISPEGYIESYIPGAMDKSTMQQAIDDVRNKSSGNKPGSN